MADQEISGASVAAGGPSGTEPASVQRELAPAARRALAEAEERRRAAKSEERPAETGGRAGPEPVRYGDWEKNGIISDF